MSSVVLGISLKEVYDMTPTELSFLVDYKAKQNHNGMVQSYEIMRLQTFLTIAPFTKIKSAKQLVKFAWDEDVKNDRPPTQLEIDEIVKNNPFPLLQK